jgi:hypothetical protein
MAAQKNNCIIVLKEETIIANGERTQQFSINKFHEGNAVKNLVEKISLTPDEMQQLRNSINLIDIKS